MDQPIICDNKPRPVPLEKGEPYFFCTCGRSNDQPFCDGSHAGTSFEPLAFTAEEPGEAWICMCKHSRGVPFCDGSHKQFTDDQVGAEGPGIP